MSGRLHDTVKVGLLQTHIDQGEKDANWSGMMRLFERLLAEEPQIVVLPEAFVSGVNFIILRQMAERIPDGPTCQRLRKLAAGHRVQLVAGVLEEGEDGRIYDSAVVIGPDGELLARYRRRFRWIGERNYISAGTEPVVVETPLGRLGLLVGYDLCFPEACAGFLAADVDIAVCVASVFERLAFNTSRLAPARAMDHHCYFLYANAVGFHQFANMRYPGRSSIHADPYYLQVQRGQACRDDLGTLAQADREPCFLTADLHIEALARARASRLPFKGDAPAALGGAFTDPRSAE